MPTSIPHAAGHGHPLHLSTKSIGLVAGVAAFALVALVPSALHRIPSLGHRPAYAAAVTVLMAIWWLTEAVPMHVTALLPLVFYPLFGVFGRGLAGDVRTSAAPFVDAYVFLFMGGMALGAAMEQWNLHRRIALHIMRAVGTSPKRLLIGMTVATAAVSLWISNTATAVMMVPIGTALVKQVQASAGKRIDRFAAAIMLAVAYGSNVGGIGTKIGTPTNSIFAGFASEKLHYEIGFLRYMAVGLPFVVLFVPVVCAVLWLLARRDVEGDVGAEAVLDRELRALGPMHASERVVAIVFLSAAALWMAGAPVRAWLARTWFGGGFLPKHYEAAVAVTAALVLAASGRLSLHSLRHMRWSTLALLGGSFAMAAGIEGSGLSHWMASQIGILAHAPPLVQLGLVSLGTIALSAVASNTATINVMLNVLPGSLPVLSAATLGASCDFMLPAGTPPNAIVFGSGLVRLPTMMKTGFVLDLSAALAIALYTWLWVGPLLR